jgi:hypothetical protein
VWCVWGCGGGFPLRSNIPRSALCATLDTYNFVKMETETILWSKHVKILVILNLKLILAFLLHQRPLVCNHRTLQNSKSSSL